ncbi:hypothetical protein [Tenacibaculum sp. nBUS_03]|uniref:hypothetical protein n=1 Tax=Tenacibaculum sp. nBUS_03 TaxID=3395320 RepID=UPI003EB8296C
MDIQNQILEFAKKYSLKEKALASIDEVMDSCIESDNEIGIDFLEGNNREDLIYEFGRFEFQVDQNDNCKIVTKIKIYSKKLYGPNYDVPVGYYEEWTDLEGEHLDEFLIFDWTPVNLNIDYHIERINKTVPQRYFRRNIPEYEFATYVNHAISLFQGKQFDGTIVFLKRCLDYLEKDINKEIEEEYLSECLELFQRVYHYVKNDNLVYSEKLDDFRISERIKNEKLTMAKKS